MNARDLINSRPLALACPVFLVLVLAACNSDSGSDPAREPIDDNCGPTSILDSGVCRPFAEREDATMSTPFEEDGQPVSLEVIIYRPLGEGRFPTVIFNHGSTGNGSDPSLFGDTFVSKTIAHFFTARGWIVAFPQRRGRGQSDGLYDEGFKPDRSGYSCELGSAIAGADRALDDLDVITDWLRARADVDSTRMLVSGTSRGGILSVAHVARRPDVYLAAINFVGGWVSEGCGDHRSINQQLFERGASFAGQTLWLYGRNDSFYSVAYSRSHFDAYSNAGGVGEFHVFQRAPGRNGHFLINDPELWAPVMDNFLESL